MFNKRKTWPVWLFLGIQAVLYAMILTTGGRLLVWTEFFAIVYCWLFAVLHFDGRNWQIVAGLFLTVCADFCLVVWQPMQQLWGMVFFLLAQSCYAWLLHNGGKYKILMLLRLGLTAAVEILAVLVLRDKTDPLALISMAYYVNLILNLVCAAGDCRKNRYFALGFMLFLLCDTVIGLQTAAGAYLPIAEGSWLYQILFMDFHLSWFFYLPSQVLIALHCRGLGKKG